MNMSTHRFGKMKWVIAAALLAAHWLLLFQDVSLNRVLCFKESGTIDLEFAGFDFRCICQDEGSDCRHCLDVPVGGAHLERILTSPGFDFTFSEQGAAEAETGAGYSGVVCTVHHLLPPIRYLPHSIFASPFPILRC